MFIFERLKLCNMFTDHTFGYCAAVPILSIPAECVRHSQHHKNKVKGLLTNNHIFKPVLKILEKKIIGNEASVVDRIFMIIPVTSYIDHVTS